MLEIDAALGGVWDRIGALLEKRGQEDASGSRRWIAGLLVNQDYDRVSQVLGINHDDCEKLRRALESQE